MKHFETTQQAKDRIEAGTIWPELKAIKKLKLSENDKKALDIIFKHMQ